MSTTPMQYASQTVKSIRTKNLTIISPDSSLQEAAQLMKELNFGVLPVGNQDNLAGNSLEGIITDRDIVLRSTANSQDPSYVTVRDCMTKGAVTIDEEATLQDAADKMSQHNISRLITTKDNKVSGLLSFGSITRACQSSLELGDIVEKAVQNRVA